MKKRTFEVDICSDSQSSLDAHASLSIVEQNRYFHTNNGFRLPLGIYNVSASRVCEKITRLSSNIERYIRAGNVLSPINRNQELMQETIDYLELTLYAAAEHVDDVISIAAGFFPTKGKAKKDQGYKKLEKAIKEHKKFIATGANYLKHKQSRIRMFSMEFRQGGVTGSLHGYFFEGVENGTICPDPTIHKEQDVFSITTLVWEALYLVLNLSKDLADFLRASVKIPAGSANIQFPRLSQAVIAAVRLPIYTFGEEHPFARSALRIKSRNNDYSELDSGLYGSIENRWSKDVKVSFGQVISRFEGDGVTKSFRFAQPKSVSFQHWE